MRRVAPTVLLLGLLLVAGPATALSVLVSGRTHEAELAPASAPASAGAAADDAPGARTEATPLPASDVRIPLVVPEASLETSPHPIGRATFHASVGRDGRVDTSDPDSLSASFHVSTARAKLPLDVALPRLFARVEATPGDLVNTRTPTWTSSRSALAAGLATAISVLLERGASRSDALVPRAQDADAAMFGTAGAPAGSPGPAEATLRTRGAANGPAPEAPAPLALAAAAAAGLLLLLAPVALYHRFRGARVLDQETRSRIMDRLRSAPGAHPSAIANALSLDPTTVCYHLRRLQAERLVVAEGGPRARRYFIAGDLAADARRAILQERVAPDVLSLVRAQPGLTKRDLSQRLSMARATLAWHLGRLQREGLVRFEREGRFVRVHPADPQGGRGRPEAF